MSKRLITRLGTAISLAFALATAAGTAGALAAPPPDRAQNGQGASGVCNMLHVGGSAVGFAGMNQSSHGNGYDIMVEDLIVPSCF